MNILVLGDIVGESAVKRVKEILPIISAISKALILKALALQLQFV